MLTSILVRPCVLLLDQTLSNQKSLSNLRPNPNLQSQCDPSPNLNLVRPSPPFPNPGHGHMDSAANSADSAATSAAPCGGDQFTRDQFMASLSVSAGVPRKMRLLALFNKPSVIQPRDPACLPHLFFKRFGSASSCWQAVGAARAANVEASAQLLPVVPLLFIFLLRVRPQLG